MRKREHRPKKDARHPYGRRHKWVDLPGPFVDQKCSRCGQHRIGPMSAFFGTDGPYWPCEGD